MSSSVDENFAIRITTVIFFHISRIFLEIPSQIGTVNVTSGLAAEDAGSMRFLNCAKAVEMSPGTRSIDIHEIGERIVIGFREMNTWDFGFLAHCEDELDDIIHRHDFKELVFDLSNVQQISSMLLGILVGLHKSGFCVRLTNLNTHVRDVVRTTGFPHLIDEPESGDS